MSAFRLDHLLSVCLERCQINRKSKWLSQLVTGRSMPCHANVRVFFLNWVLVVEEQLLSVLFNSLLSAGR